jgi:hypothetical protein
MTNCTACEKVLEPESEFPGDPPAEYQFNNVLWIGFHGGYGMFVDHMAATFPMNSAVGNEHMSQLWAWGPDGGMVLDDAGHSLPNPNWEPVFEEKRILAAGGTQPDHEAVLCHECAHKLCDENPWLTKLLTPHNSHSHKTAYHDAHPDHYGWDYDRA